MKKAARLQRFPAHHSYQASQDTLGGRAERLVRGEIRPGGQPVSPSIPVFFGYQECAAYTVLDQSGEQIKDVDMVLDEDIQVVDTNVGLTSRTTSGTTDSEFMLKDQLNFGSATHAPGAGSFAVDKQTITFHVARCATWWHTAARTGTDR